MRRCQISARKVTRDERMRVVDLVQHFAADRYLLGAVHRITRTLNHGPIARLLLARLYEIILPED